MSVSYLEQIFSQLRKNELVFSTRGPGGGYCLSRDTADISIPEIIDAISIEAYKKQSRKDKIANESDQPDKHAHSLWLVLNKQIHKFLCDISLADLIR